MSNITVRTQAGFDAAWAEHWDDPAAEIVIESPRGVWIDVTDSGSSTVGAYDSATVRASGSATVTASDSATVTAYDSATVTASDSATVTAYDSATVRASDSATVRAYDSATVRASGSATVTAGSHVAVHLHSAHVTISGGVIIDATKLDHTDQDTWVAYTGARVVAGVVTLYKAVDDNLTAGRRHIPTTYPIGQDVTAADWRDDNSCGNGLHASPHPHQSLAYAPDATRMLEVTVPLADLRPIPGSTAKAKAQTMHVVREVTLDGADMPAAAVSK